MTPLPKRRWSTRRQGKKRATLKAAFKTPARCSNCGELKVSHFACAKCGFYNGKKVITIKKPIEDKN